MSARTLKLDSCITKRLAVMYSIICISPADIHRDNLLKCHYRQNVSRGLSKIDQNVYVPCRVEL